MKEQIEKYFKDFEPSVFDIRRIVKKEDTRFMDQKVTPDVLCIMADCVINYVADRDIEFTKNDIWKSEYFRQNVEDIFKKPDVRNKTTRLEYDKFTSQPLRTLAFAKILILEKRGRTNWYKVANKPILEFIAWNTRKSRTFLYIYLLKVLESNGLLKDFEEFKKKCLNKTITNNDFKELKDKYSGFIRGNTNIKTKTEVNRIFTKVLNIYAYQNNIRGTLKGHLSKRPIYPDELMYNRLNWRDIKKEKGISRQETMKNTDHETSMAEQNEAYLKYYIQKAKNIIKRIHKESEVKDEEWKSGKATQVHHIFPQSEFPKIAFYLENLINLTPNQHNTKAHPNNKTREINRDYQLVCLLAKSDSIESSLKRREFFYKKESFITVINKGLEGLTNELDYKLEFVEIKRKLINIYDNI